MNTESNRPVELTAKEQKFLESYGIEGDAKIAFQLREPKTLLLLMLLTSGFYGLYWFYKNWQAITTVTEHKISPFWRTAFTVFYAWPLFKIMVLQAKTRGFDKNYSGGWLTLGYLFVPSIISSLYHPKTYNAASVVVSLVAVAASVWFLTRAQEAAAFAVDHDATDGFSAYGEVSRFEKGFALVGILAAAGLYLLLFLSKV